MTKSYYSSFIDLFVQVVLLSIFSLIIFYHQSDILFQGNDGPTLISHIDVQQYFFGVTPHLYNNMLEGISNLTYPLNVSMLPIFWWIDLTHLTPFSIAMIYTWFSMQLFLSILLIAWNYGFSSRVAYFSSWLLTTLAFPYFIGFRIYPITASTPVIICQITAFALMCVGISRMGKDGWRLTVLYAVIFFLGLLMELVMTPASFILIGPALVVMTVLAIVTACDRQELILKIAILSVSLILSYLVGWIHLVLGLILNSAASFFNHDFSDVTTGYVYASLLFHGKYSGYEMGVWLFCCATLGCVIACRDLKLRSLAVTVLVVQAAIAGGGGLLLMNGTWNGPAPIYCEIAFFPFYALFSVYMLTRVIMLIPFNWDLRVGYLFSIQLGMMAFLIYYSLVNQPAVKSTYRFNVNPESSSVIKILENEIATHAYSRFHGRVANVLPQKDWRRQFEIYSDLDVQRHNDHHSTGLWLKHIPTLHEYNQLLTPAYYFFYRKFLSDGNDVSNRSWSNYNVINDSILELLGVSYLLTTMPNLQNAKRVAYVDTNTTGSSLYLYRLANPNMNGISVTKVLNFASFQEVASSMKTRKFDTSQALVVNQPGYQYQAFEHVIEKNLFIGKGGIMLHAKSHGKSMLVLPFEYSSCLHVKVISGLAPEMIRVDLALIGVIFDRNVDVIINTRTGPFANPKCRWNDYFEWKRNYEA